MNDGDLPLEVLFNGLFWLWLLALVPAAVVTVLKGRLALFFAGWLTLGLTWLIGAFWIADPDTAWAQWFYGERRMARAEDPVRYRRPVRVSVAWIAGGLAALLAVGFFAARPTPLLGMDAATLQHSVGGGPFFSSARPCLPVDERTWTCSAYDGGDSSDVPYRVKTNRLGCWTATYVGFKGNPDPRRRFSSCVTIWDQLGLWDLLP